MASTSPRYVPRLFAGFAGLALLSSVGCAAANHTSAGTAWGAGLGTLAGAVIGHQTGHTGTGALVGAVAGGMTGALVGNAADAQEERDAAVQYAGYVSEERRRAEILAMSQTDLIRLIESGASDDVVVAAIRSRGVRFDLGPDEIIRLKNAGVSDAVILASQEAAARPLPTAPMPPTYVVGPTSEIVAVPTVVVAPRPYWHRPYWYRPHWHHRSIHHFHW